MGPFLEPVESAPILKGPKKGSQIRTRFWPRFSHNFAPSPVNFLNPQIRNETVENKHRERRLPVQILSQQELLISELETTTIMRLCTT